MHSLIYHEADVKPGDPVGGKAGALAALRDQGFRIPPWFVFCPAALANDNDDQARLDAFSPSTNDALRQALAIICPHGELVAVRSSAMEEDGALSSFAGQFETFLSVAHHEVPVKAMAVWQSARSERVLNYRRQRGIESAPTPPAVLVQRMVGAEFSGIAFGADPVTADEDTVVISAIEGLGDTLVSGQNMGQTTRVDDSGHVRRDFNVPAFLSDAKAREVASLTRRLGKYFGRPQDVEWAIAGDELFLLQSRPITTLSSTSSSELKIWDNSNIVESYRGITTPLTFTFARAAYEGVYRQFCRILCVSSSAIRANDKTFKNMLGWINGRIYYNLINWYRVLAMLPGYKVNRRFMEQMMGVKEALPEKVERAIGVSGNSGKLADGFRLLLSMASLIANLITLKSRSRRFYARLFHALREPETPLNTMTVKQLAGHYRELERRLLTRWDAPLLNDFFCMIFYGVLKKLCVKWGSGEEALQEELLQGTGKMISAEPAARLRNLALIALQKPGFTDLLISGSLDRIHRKMESFPDFKSSYEGYLEKFGDRCLEELKLETPTLHDYPLPLLRAIGHFSNNLDNETPIPQPHGESAVTKLERAMAGHPLRKLIFGWIRRQTRARLRDRENLRFERTRVFGRVRRIFVQIGRRFYESNHLDNARDVFYLELDEVLAFAHGRHTECELRLRVNERKEMENQYHKTPPPPDRFETWGEIDLYVAPEKLTAHEAAGQADDSGACRRGIGCSAGVVRGMVRVVHDPRNSQLQSGEILVAESTDPGWILIFPLASGIIVERGSPLSHSAIVSRELGIPAVVGLGDATRWLQDGDLVELDGATGIVQKH